MEIASLIISIIGVVVSVIGIFVSSYYWKHTAKEVEQLRKLKSIDFTEEHSFSLATNIILQLLKENPTSKNPYNPQDPKELLMWCMFNFLQNIYNKKD